MTRRRYRCRFCGQVLCAWLPVAREPNGALLLQHLSHTHPDRVGAYLARMQTDEDMTRVAVEAYEVVDGDEQG